MITKNALVAFCIMLLLSALPSIGMAQNDPSVIAHDAARNDLVQKVSPAIYYVEASFRFHKQGDTKTLGKKDGSGTAFGVTENGLVMTAYHVVQAPVFNLRTPLGPVELAPKHVPPKEWNYDDGDAAEGTYTLITKSGEKYTAEIVAVDPKNDLAILSITGSVPGKKFPVIAFESDPLRYESVIAIGAPFGFAFTVAEGIISNPVQIGNHKGDERKLVQTSVMVHPGNSGGPLMLFHNHKVAGVIIELYNPLQSVGIGIAFAVPASVAAQFLGDTLRKLDEAAQKNAPGP